MDQKCFLFMTSSQYVYLFIYTVYRNFKIFKEIYIHNSHPWDRTIFYNLFSPKSAFLGVGEGGHLKIKMFPNLIYDWCLRLKSIKSL